VRSHPNEVCPAEGEERRMNQKPSIDLVGRI